ncbi:MAG: hypothetical protein U0514_01970 [Candidatus Andersenbacteria bacterium]
MPYDWRPSLDGVHETADVIYWTCAVRRKLSNGHSLGLRLAAIKKQYVIG